MFRGVETRKFPIVLRGQVLLFVEISWAKPTRWHGRRVVKPPGGSVQRLVGYGTGLRPLLIRQVSRTWAAKLLVRHRTVPTQFRFQPVRKDRPLLESTSLL